MENNKQHPRPRISVCMATYNGQKFLRMQIESILSQLEETDELIISDDNSTDQTVDILREYTDKIVKLHVSSGPRGINGNFNNALSLAQGDYVFLADQDDIWHPEKVRTVAALLHDHILVLSDCEVIDESEHTISRSLFNLRGIGYTGFRRNLHKNSFTGCAMAFQRDLLKTALPIPQDIPMYDWWLGLLASRLGKVAVVNKPLVKYRLHQRNASPTGTGSFYNIFQQLDFRLKISLHVFFRLLIRKLEK